MSLQRGGQAVIGFDRLTVSGTVASGQIMPVADGLTGRLGISGGGVTGYVALQPMHGVQQIKTELAARDADIVGTPPFHVRSGTMIATSRSKPEGPRIDEKVDARG